jgi:hypothetical protein
LTNLFEKVANRIGVCPLSAQKEKRDSEGANPAEREEAGH